MEEMGTDDSRRGLHEIHEGHMGRGAAASRPFKPGEFVVEYAGDLLVGKKRTDQRIRERDGNEAYMFHFQLGARQYW